MDTGWMGASVAWRDPGCKIRKTYLDINKEAFDAELYGVREALGIAMRGREIGLP